ncbi:MAG: hypothetical protein IKA79_04895 [Lentisphaeria bacterium]|nr:hypothetical protein [Lentisphaeria bacterium]
MVFVAFLKKHYEKLILGVLLLIFIGLLIYLGILVRATRQLKIEEENTSVLRANYEKQAGKLSAEKEFRDFKQWVKAPVSREKKGSDFPEYAGDFIIPEALTICHDCRKAIPVTDFKVGTRDHKFYCTLKGHLLKPPTSLEIVDKGKDTDKDGIPDEYENKYREYGYNPEDSSDVSLDFDNDFFSNLEEYLCDTDPLNARVAPTNNGIGGSMNGRLAYNVLLMCAEVFNTKYDFTIRSISKDRVSIVVYNPDPRRPGRRISSSKTLKVGEVIEAPGVRIMIKGIEQQGRKYVAVLHDTFSGDEWKAERNAARTDSVSSPYTRARIVFRGNNVPFVLKSGQSITLGNDVTGKETYKVKSVDKNNRTVVLVDESNKKEVTVGSRMEILDILARKKAEKDAEKERGKNTVVERIRK